MRDPEHRSVLRLISSTRPCPNSNAGDHGIEIHMTTPRIRRFSDRRKLEAARADFLHVFRTQGYEVRRDVAGSLLMRKRTWGSINHHVIVALGTGWWTLGLGNLVFALLARIGADRVALQFEAPAARRWTKAEPSSLATYSGR
jgi:hypothetical protein